METVPFVSQENFSIAKLDEDIFIEMAKKIFNSLGFSALNKYYYCLKSCKDEITLILNSLYIYLDNNDKESIEKSYSELFKIKDTILDTIQLLNYNLKIDITYFEIIEYFENINVKDLNHYENGELIISKLHQEWITRLINLSHYYNLKNQEVDEIICKKSKSKINQLSNWFKKALTNSSKSNVSNSKIDLEALEYIDY